MIEKFTVSRDDDVYEAWPDVAKSDDGALEAAFDGIFSKRLLLE